MIRQITGTIASRIITAVMNLLLTMLAGHALGAEGLGVISLVLLGITLVMLPANLVGGGALVFLVPREPLGALLRPAYAWGAVSAVLAFAVLQVLPLVPPGFEAHVCLLAFLQAFYSANLGVLAGQQRMRAHNTITALQAMVMLGVFAGLVLLGRDRGPMDYVYACYAAFGLTAVLTALAIDRHRQVPQRTEAGGTMRILIRQGLLVQGANAAQLINYRLAYWLIEHFRGKAALGVYSVGNQLAESAWLAPRSLGLVLLSRVSNLDDAEHQRRLTLTIARLAVTLAVGVLVLLAVVPDALFPLVFGREITHIRPIMLLLAPGIIAMAASQAFSHYFSGTGRNVHNLIGSGIGMVITCCCGLWLIPRIGLRGAALTASMAYGASVVYQVIVFMRSTNSSLHELLPNASDMRRAREAVRTLFARA
mgnify:CR=1 FL=1